MVFLGAAGQHKPKRQENSIQTAQIAQKVQQIVSGSVDLHHCKVPSKVEPCDLVLAWVVVGVTHFHLLELHCEILVLVLLAELQIRDFVLNLVNLNLCLTKVCLLLVNVLEKETTLIFDAFTAMFEPPRVEALFIVPNDELWFL